MEKSAIVISREPVPYNLGAGDTMLKLDEMCSWVGAPHPTHGLQVFKQEMEKQYRKPVPIIPRPAKITWFTA
ncbi:MAG: hypothetical protein ACLVD8_27385 [Enterocloster sp.]|uniref:hypothetical protein n=1 Tax=Enterocloster sp. TaxID=2719315 RepID=UPI00399A997C